MVLATPTGISIYTKSCPGSPRSPIFGYLPIVSATDTAIHRILSYAHMPNTMIQSDRAGSIFNDLQLILSSEREKFDDSSLEEAWNPALPTEILKLRNLMNLTRRLKKNPPGM
jgi:hypothetical protein